MDSNEAQEFYVRVASIAAKVRIGYISNENIKSYRYSRLLNNSILNATVFSTQSVMCNNLLATDICFKF